MLKEFAQYLVSLKDNKTYEINGETYSDNALVRIKPHVDRPEKLTLNSLDGVVKMIRTELDISNVPLFIRVNGAQSVDVFSTLDSEMGRDFLYSARCDVPGFKDGFRPYDKFIIELRSRFDTGNDVDYLLDLLCGHVQVPFSVPALVGIVHKVTFRKVFLPFLNTMPSPISSGFISSLGSVTFSPFWSIL